MSHGRKYGEKPAHPIYVSNGILEPKHVKKIGSAIFVFLWLIDRTTRHIGGVGIVLGGKPIKAGEVAKSLGVYEQTFRRHLDRLARHNYIERTLTPYGYVIRILKDYKFAKQVVQNCPTSQDTGSAELPDLTMQDCPTSLIKFARPNKSKQLEESVEQASSGLWAILRIDPCRLRPPFKKHCEDLFARRKGQPIGEFVGVCMDSWELLGNKIPATFAQAVRSFRERSRATTPAAPITYLPEMPFKKRDPAIEELCPKKS